jgi:dUTP pyrophosphatase
MLVVNFKKLKGTAKLPVKGSLSAACYDVYATSMSLDDVGMLTYGLGFATEIPEGWRGVIVPRSNLSKFRWVLSNSIGIVDSDYRGEWMVKMKSVSLNPREAAPYQVGERVAQIYFEKNVDVAFAEVEELDKTERGEGGFGSTGVGVINISPNGTDVTYAKPEFVTNTTADVKTNYNS